MLEHKALLLLPWESSGAHLASPDAYTARMGPRRAVLDPTSREALGFAFWRDPRLRPWLRWLLPPVLEVRETDDAALLCSVRRSWALSMHWEVRDAEGIAVGACRRLPYWGERQRWVRRPDEADLSESLAGMSLEDRFRRPYGWLESKSSGGTRQFRSTQGEALGALTSSDRGLLLSFSALSEGNPFARMVLLAAALIAADS